MTVSVAADLILRNGKFHTQHAGLPLAEAVAAASGRVLAVGSNERVAEFGGPLTEWVDLEQRLALPGFSDVHFHYVDWALGRMKLDLSRAASLSELIGAVNGAAANKKRGDWILGQGFNEAAWPEGRMPTRRELDTAAPEHPVLLWRCDLHLAVANSRALALAGMQNRTPDPPQGIIDRDGSGRPTGILKETAVDLVKNALPEIGEKDCLQAMRTGIPALHAMGITGLHDIRIMGGRDAAMALRAWQRLREAGELDLRCWVTLPAERLREAVDLGLRSGLGDDRLRLGHVKFFADGGMGARTAWMLEPYRDGGCGMPLLSMDRLEAAISTADRAGLAVAVHAVGDRAGREVIGIFERLAARRSVSEGDAFNRPRLPHRIEHLQMIQPQDLARLAPLKIAVAMQPPNAILDMAMIDDAVGSRARHAYAFRSALEAGIQLCLSSDAPVCDPNPLLGIHAAVTRRRPDGSPAPGWHPEQCLTVSQAVCGYTLAPAALGGAADRLGCIAPGRRADIVVLDRNLYEIDPAAIPEARVAMTVFDGKVVYRRETA
jgi:predicted amidohydrolase YtcJ